MSAVGEVGRCVGGVVEGINHHSRPDALSRQSLHSIRRSLRQKQRQHSATALARQPPRHSHGIHTGQVFISK
ncbi:hypothetical protein [Scytonema sp. UIC 10036]|uniref:hypothetical protein n=1 Tax=Scytonema sp. UIC 10036 TaxID=2304196 RepID=UPI00140FEB19|nr:hypothetical protein [Scytonema sp. UIC 10036]